MGEIKLLLMLCEWDLVINRIRGGNKMIGRICGIRGGERERKRVDTKEDQRNVL